ncbi:MAG: hypothetical protein CAF41_006035 [Nitrospira sp. CG24A]|nr:MAG: hypothetical protein CAF41_006035 [Nitrospira sp. CG24A]
MKPGFTTAATGLFFLGLIGLFMPASGHAHSASFIFTGELVAADPHSIGGMVTDPTRLSPRSMVSGFFTFDANTVDTNASGTVGQYNGAISSLWLSVTNMAGAPYLFSFNPAGPLNTIQVNADPLAANQSYTMATSINNVVPSGPIIDGDNYYARDFFMNLLNPASNVFANDALPETPSSLSPFSPYCNLLNPDGQFRLVFAGGQGDVTLIGNLTSLSAVPLPAAAWLFGSGVIGLIGFARRKMSAMA